VGHDIQDTGSSLLNIPHLRTRYPGTKDSFTQGFVEMGRLQAIWFIAIFCSENQAYTQRRAGSSLRLKSTRKYAAAWFRDEDRPLRTIPPGYKDNQTTRPRKYDSMPPSRTNPNPRVRTKAFQKACRILRETRTPFEIMNWMTFLVERNLNLGLDPREGPEFIKELANRKAYDAMLIFLRNMSDRSVFVYTSAISVLAQSERRRQQAMELLDEMNHISVEPTTYTFTALFNSVDGAQASMKLLERVQNSYPQVAIGVEVYNAAIHACSRGERQEWNIALKLFFQMKTRGIQPNQHTFASLLHSCARAGQLRVALSLLQEMKLTMIPNAKVWGAALNACAQAGNYKEATKILNDMQDMGITPTTWHLSALLTALAKAGQHELALEMLDGMEQGNPIVLPLAGGNKRVLIVPAVPLDIISINTVLFACAKVENSSGAKDLLGKLKSGHYTTLDSQNKRVPILPDEISYNAVLAACRDPAEAKGIVKEMRMSRRNRHGATPPSRITYTHAISACRKAKEPDLETALYFLEAAKSDGIEPNVFMYSAAIWTAERCGDSDIALAILDKMKEVKCEPNAVTYLGVISTLAVAGRAIEAIQMFEEMKSSGIDPTEQIFSKLAVAIRNARISSLEQITLLERVLDRMDASEMRSNLGGRVLEAMIISYGMQRRFEDAFSVFDMIAGQTDGPCLCAILSACSMASPPRWKEALQIIHTSDIIETAKGPAKFDPRSIGFAIIACSKADEWKEALSLLYLYGQSPPSERSALGDENATIPTAAMNSLISACGRNGRPDMALRILNEMQFQFGIVPDEISYRSAAIACNQAEHEKRRRLALGLEPRYNFEYEGNGLQWWECTLSLLRRMNENGLQADPQTYSSVISACEAAGEWQRALGVLRAMMSSKLGFSRFNLYCFNAAISACEKGGAWVEGLELYHRMMHKGGKIRPNFVTVNCMIIALDKANQKEMAQDTYEEAIRKRILNPWRMTKDFPGNSIRALDLHRNSGSMAKSAIRSVMESLFEAKPQHDVNQDLVIIVGKGKGSDNNKSVLLPTAQTLLQNEYGIDVQVDKYNSGRLIVGSSVLSKYAAAKKWR